MRFLADMGISPLVVKWLNDNNHKATHLRDENLQRSPDDIVLVKALDEKRVLLTSDLDFGYLLAISKAVMPSVILFRLTDMRPNSVIERLNTAIHHFNEQENGLFVVVTDSGIRVRQLPIGEELE